MRIAVNGKEMQFEGPLSVTGLLESLGVNPRAVVVERNLTILDRDRFSGEAVQDGDSIEIIRFVGGG
ncbi:MAG: sulfur carrier protein ThiS [Syntrophobacteraceae bacterium]|nr:sulfur carrier protein ThiS [Syntrophobacteraceae bacterium]